MSKFTIREIEHLTGIRSHTLRIWEQRYNLPQPKRTPGNVRYYDDEDLKLLLNISMLNRHGHKISKISKLTGPEIARMAIDLSAASDSHPAHIHALLSSMIDLDEAAFNKVLSSALLQYGLEKTMMDIVFPFMSLIGVMWQTGSLMPPYEHFISALLRQKLMVAIDGQLPVTRADAKHFLLFLPEGENHELGLLFAQYLIRAAGHRVLYLGQNLPAHDLENISGKFAADYVFISLTSGFSSEDVKSFVGGLRSKFPSAGLLLTGRYFQDYPYELPERTTVIRHPGDLKAFFV